MVLAQDQTQASQAQAVLDEQQYQKELAQYNKDKAEYDKKKAEYDAQQKKIEDAKAKEQARIAEEERLAKEKADKRAAQFAAVEKTYQETLAKDPNLGADFPNPRSNIGSGYKQSYQKAKSSQLYQARALESKQEAQAQLRYQHYTEDGFTFASGGTGQSDFGKAVADYNMGRPLGYRKISARGQHQFNLWLAKNDLLYGRISEDQYHSRTGSSQSSYKSHEQKAAEQRSKQAQAKVAGYLAADAKHWQSVASGNYDAQYPTESTPTLHPVLQKQQEAEKNLESIGVSVSSNTKVETKDHGYYTETILSGIENAKSKSSPVISKYITVSDQTFKVPETPTTPTIPVRTNTSSNKGVNEANILQKQYVQDVRDGKIPMYEALTNPRTPQMVSKNNTINLNQYLTERGYDVTKPETIPDSVLMDRVKYDAARKQASDTSKPMGDLRKLVPNQPQVSDAVLQQRKETMEKYVVDKGGSFIGYGPDGSPVQGAPNPEFFKQQYQVTTADGTVRTFNSLEHAQKFSQRMATTQYEVNIPTTIPTMYGAITVQEPITFDSKEEAQAFIDNRQANLPYTQDSKILPLEKMYKGYDQFADEAYQRAEEHPDSWIYQGGAAWTSFGADMLNLVTMGGDLIDKHVLNRPVVEKQPVSTIPTYYDKGFEKAIQGIELTETGVTGVTPSLVNPLDEGNVVSKWYQGAAKQWEKQTPAQNIGQSTVIVPMAIVDAVTATGVIKKAVPVVTKVAAKVAATPRIVTKVIESSSISVKTIPVKQSYAKYNLNTIANPDRIDLNLKGADYYDKGYHLKSPKPAPLNLQSKAFQEDLSKTRQKGDVTTWQGDTVKEPFANPFVKFWDKVTPKEPPKPSQYRAATQSDVKIVKGKKPVKPTHQEDPYFIHDRNPRNIKEGTPTKGADWIEPSTAPKIDLQSKSFLKDVRKQTRKIDYERYADEFVKFQKTLDPKPQRYSKIDGKIKLSEGFIPGKPTRQYKPHKPKEVQEEPFYKADGKIGDILSDTISHSPLTVRTTNPDKIVKMPKTGKAPTVNNEKYLEGLDFQPAKTPKGSHAPIGYITPKPKPLPKTSTFPKMKSTAKKINLPKPDDTPKPKETSQILEPPKPIPKTKKKSTPQPPDPIIDASTDTPIPVGSKSPNNSLIIPPVVKTHQEQKPLPIKSATIPRVIQTIKVTQTPVVKERQSIGIRSSSKQTVRSVQSSRIIQSQPQKVTQVVRQKQSLRSPSSPKPKVKQAAHPIFRLKAPQRITQPEPMRPRAIAVAAVLPPPKEKKTQEKKIRKRKQKDFLGNTRTDHIVGLFKRTEIITGDKKVSKQLKKDKKYKEGIKKKRIKKKTQSFLQKQGVLNKGFKF